MLFCCAALRCSVPLPGTLCCPASCPISHFPKPCKTPRSALSLLCLQVICVFDADQVPNADFFTKTVPMLDGGQDVAMVLTPQVDVAASQSVHACR